MAARETLAAIFHGFHSGSTGVTIVLTPETLQKENEKTRLV
jgi:hypothetical protein